MTFGAPLLAAIAAAIAIPALVILYFLKLRRRTVEVSTTLLWKKAIQDLQANAPFQKLRKNLLLFLQLLILIAALIALAQPRSAQTTQAGRRLVLFIDRSASMNAIDDPSGRTRLEIAKERALAQIDAMQAAELFGDAARSDQATIIAFDATAEILAQFTADKPALRAAVESITPTDGPSNLLDAFKLAQANRPRHSNAAADTDDPAAPPEGLLGDPFHFHLYSDGRVLGLPEIDPKPTDAFEYHAIGSESALNIALVSLRAERGYEDPTVVTIYIGVQSTDPSPRAVDIELGIDGVGIAGVKTLRIEGATQPTAAPEGTPPTPAQSGVVFELQRPTGFLATVALRTGDDAAGDALRTDNLGWLVVPPARRTAVGVVTSGNLFIREALGGLPLSRLDSLTPAQYERLAADGEADRYDVVVLDGYLPEPMRRGESLPGRWLILNSAPPPPFGVTDAGESGPTAILDWSRTHPVLRDVVLDGLRLARSRAVTLPEGSSGLVLAETPAGPAILEIGSADSRALLLPFDVAQSNWPFDVGFVVFLASAIDYLAADAAVVVDPGAAQRQFVPGQVLTARLPASAAGVRLQPPEGAPGVELVPGADGAIAYGPLRRTGVYRVRWQGEPGPSDVTEGNQASRIFAVNLLDPIESDIAAVPALDLASRQTTANAAGETDIVREHWPWLLLAALAVMMFEWWIYNRRVYV